MARSLRENLRRRLGREPTRYERALARTARDARRARKKHIRFDGGKPFEAPEVKWRAVQSAYGHNKRSVRVYLAKIFGRESTKAERDEHRRVRDAKRHRHAAMCAATRAAIAATSLAKDLLQMIADALLSSRADAWSLIAMAGTCTAWRVALNDCWRSWLFSLYPHVRKPLHLFGISLAADHRRIFLTQLRAEYSASQPPPDVRIDARAYVVTAWLKGADGTVLASATAWLGEPLDLGPNPELTYRWDQAKRAMDGNRSELPLPVVLDLAVTRKCDLDTLYLMQDAPGDWSRLTRRPACEIACDFGIRHRHSLFESGNSLPRTIGKGSSYMRAEAQCADQTCPDQVHLRYCAVRAESPSTAVPLEELIAYLAIEAPWPSNCWYGAA